MIWNKSLETGIEMVDQQHKQLFDQIDILMDTKNKERIDTTLGFLGQYIIKHFTDEQMLHLKSKYPKAAIHRGYHDNFIAVFKQLKEKYEKEGQSLMTVLEINKTVMNWLKEHILIHDMEFTRYYKANNP